MKTKQLFKSMFSLALTTLTVLILSLLMVSCSGDSKPDEDDKNTTSEQETPDKTVVGDDKMDCTFTANLAQVFTVTENVAIGTVIGKIDVEAKNNTEAINYGFGNGIDGVALNNSTGELTVTDNFKFDYENKSTLTDFVIISSKDCPQTNIDITINITNIEAPTNGLIAAYNFDNGSAQNSAAVKLIAIKKDISIIKAAKANNVSPGGGKLIAVEKKEIATPKNTPITTPTPFSIVRTNNRSEKASSAVLFNGTSSVVKIPNSQLLSNDIAISLWFMTNQSGVLIGQQNAAIENTPSQYVPILYVRKDGKLNASLWGTNQQFNNNKSSQKVNDAKWHHVVITGSSTKAEREVYLDNVKVGNYNQKISILSGMTFNQIGTGYTVGQWPSGNSGYFPFNGTIDDVKIYNRLLSETDVANLYNE